MRTCSCCHCYWPWKLTETLEKQLWPVVVPEQSGWGGADSVLSWKIGWWSNIVATLVYIESLHCWHGYIFLSYQASSQCSNYSDWFLNYFLQFVQIRIQTRSTHYIWLIDLISPFQIQAAAPRPTSFLALFVWKRQSYVHRIPCAPDLADCVCGLVLAGDSEHASMPCSILPPLWALTVLALCFLTSFGRAGRLTLLRSLVRPEDGRISKEQRNIQTQCEKVEFSCFAALNFKNLVKTVSKHIFHGFLLL